MPNIKRVFITAERSLTVWDFRSNKQQKKSNVSDLSNLFCFVFFCMNKMINSIKNKEYNSSSIDGKSNEYSYKYDVHRFNIQN